MPKTIEEILSEIETIGEECGEAGWDGYDALPITRHSLDTARGFLNFASTLGWSHELSDALSVAPLASGSISFEWYWDKKHQLMAEAAPSSGVSDPALYFAWINGEYKLHHAASLNEHSIKELVELLHQIKR